MLMRVACLRALIAPWASANLGLEELLASLWVVEVVRESLRVRHAHLGTLTTGLNSLAQPLEQILSVSLLIPLRTAATEPPLPEL